MSVALAAIGGLAFPGAGARGLPCLRPGPIGSHIEGRDDGACWKRDSQHLFSGRRARSPGRRRARCASAADVLKIGVLGRHERARRLGPGSRHTPRRRPPRCTTRPAAWISAAAKYQIEVDAVDDQADPELAVTGAQRLILQDRIKYIIGPNVDPTDFERSADRREIRCDDGLLLVHALAPFSPPHRNTVLGIIPGYQNGPVVFGSCGTSGACQRSPSSC